MDRIVCHISALGVLEARILAGGQRDAVGFVNQPKRLNATTLRATQAAAMPKTMPNVEATESRLINKMCKSRLTWSMIQEMTGHSSDDG